MRFQTKKLQSFPCTYIYIYWSITKRIISNICTLGDLNLIKKNFKIIKGNELSYLIWEHLLSSPFWYISFLDTLTIPDCCSTFLMRSFNSGTFDRVLQEPTMISFFCTNIHKPTFKTQATHNIHIYSKHNKIPCHVWGPHLSCASLQAEKKHSMMDFH